MQISITGEQWQTFSVNLAKVLGPQSILIGKTSTGAVKCLKESGFMVFSLVGGVMLAITPQKPRRLEGKEISIVGRGPNTKNNSLSCLTSPRLSDLHSNLISQKRSVPISVT